MSLDVTNTGKRAGSQVIQLYIHEQGGLFARPEKELRDFAKVFCSREKRNSEITYLGEDFAVSVMYCINGEYSQTDMRFF